MEQTIPSELSTVSSVFIPENIFRVNDIRGIAESEVTPDFAYQLGSAFAKIALAHDQHQIYVCRDGRLSSPELCAALQKGLRSEGLSIIDLGIGPTPLLNYVLSRKNDQNTGIMVTASHNGKEYNGFKIALCGESFCGEEIQNLLALMKEPAFTKISINKNSNGEDTTNKQTFDATANYLESLAKDIPDLSALKVVIEGANGAAGPLAVRVFERLGSQTESLFCTIDGNFPNHPPDPCKANHLTPLCEKVLETSADFGIALDGDGDRVVIVSDQGQILTPDQLYQIFAKSLLDTYQNTAMVFDVKASRGVQECIETAGSTAIMEKSGRTYIQARVKQTNAVLGGEYSSHYFFGDRWHAVDDGIYAACRLAEILIESGKPLSELLQDTPSLPCTEELEILIAEEEKAAIFEKFRQNANFDDAQIINIDGLRVEYPWGWGLIRVSNTGPKLSVRFEGNTEQYLQQIQDIVRTEFKKILPKINLPF